MLKTSSPIGVFDSGIGGLTVVKQLISNLPNESIVYFGDTARVPYGTKSKQTVRRYANEVTSLLLEYSPKLIIAACNTVSALALDVVKQTASPVYSIGVLEASAKLAISLSKNKRIGVIGTTATISSKSYSKIIKRKEKFSNVFEVPCPLFVPFAEEGLFDHKAIQLVAEEYLLPLKKEHIDTLILGCTHYPILRSIIEKVIGKNVYIVDSAISVSKEVSSYLRKHSLNSNDLRKKFRPNLKILFSDTPRSFTEIAERFVGTILPKPEIIREKA